MTSDRTANAETTLKVEIEKDIANLSLSVPNPQQPLGTLVPIHRLPSELLVEIFYLCQDKLWVHKNGMRGLGWITLTEVCGHWRDLAIHTPGLWVNINLGHPRSMSRRSLSLSKDLRLHIQPLQS